MPHSEAIQRLIDGNQRFVNGVRSVESLLAHMKMAELATKGQNPFAVVLTCSDSRSPAEMIFDQGLGDLFVVRVAGNVVAPSLLASIEFAVSNLGSSAIVVLGHSLCGAIQATIQHLQGPSSELASPHLEELIGRIRPAVKAAEKSHDPLSSDFVHHATLSNIERSRRLILEQSRIVRDLHDAGKVSIEGALLDIATGKVTFLGDT
ncbi:carbonic anhydrase, partial [bacterium]|nr:carbonic anhydrase [bacterium]